MKFGFMCLLAMSSMALAHQFPGPAGPNITGCSKWSGLTFCKDWFGPPWHATSEAARCQATYQKDDWVIYNQYTRPATGPRVPFKKIYVRDCLAWIYSSFAQSPMRLNMITEVQDLFPGEVYVSNSHITEQGSIKLYVLEMETHEIYEATFDEAGSLDGMLMIDQATNEYFLAVLETTGLSFGPLGTE